MRTLFLEIRVQLTRLLYFVLGLRIDHWRKKVVSLWSVGDKELEQVWEQCLKITCPKNADGIQVKSLQALRESPPLSKFQLREQTPHSFSCRSKFFRHTAGSIGEPTDIWLNRNELGRMLGVRDYCYRQCGTRLGEREARFWGRPEDSWRTKFKNSLLNRRIFHPVGDRLAEETKSLVKWRPKYIYGYASLLMECARELERTGKEISGLHCVICTAETILPSQKEYLNNIFKCPVFEEYGSTEFDIIAFDCLKGHRHLVNPWLVIETDKVGHCLITDVCRSSQSLIRYQLGDVLKLSKVTCNNIGSCTVLKGIEGRSINRFAFVDKNRRFHAVEFSHAVDSYQRQTKELFRFTIFQVEYAEFELLCEPEPRSGVENVAEFLRQALVEKTGFDITIKARPDGMQYKPKQSYFIQSMNDSQIE